MLLVKRLVWLLAHIVQKVARWHVFYHDIEGFIILKAFNERKHLSAVVAGKLLHDFNLLEHLIVPVKVTLYLGFFDCLQRELLIRIPVLYQSYLTKGAFAEEFDWLISFDARV